MAQNIYRNPPKRFEAVWVEGRRQPNGYILRIDYKEQEVIVRFHDTKETDSFTFDELEGNWHNGFQQWLIHNIYK
jgi:hypothetical protein